LSISKVTLTFLNLEEEKEQNQTPQLPKWLATVTTPKLLLPATVLAAVAMAANTTHDIGGISFVNTK
jgi:hypothetical protein